jgi:hypothetical protein
MKAYIKFIIAIILVFGITSIQAQPSDMTYDRFPFEYNKRSKTTEVATVWNKTFANLKSQFLNENNIVILHSYSSATGKKEYNYKLSKDRGNAVKTFLANKGVQRSRIQIEAHGEPNIEDYGDEDYAGDRNVLPVFKRKAQKKYVDPIDKYRNKETLEQDIKDGNKIFQNLVGPDIENIKKKYQMVRKVFLENPSADPEELAEQVKGILKEMKEIKNTKDLVEFVGKIGLDAFVDLFTSSGTREVNMARQIKYDVIIEAMASECFPRYKAATGNYDFDQKMLFYSVKLKLSKLSNHDKYKLRARFIAGKTFDMDAYYTAKIRFEKEMQNVSMFKRNLDHWFDQSEFRYRD